MRTLVLVTALLAAVPVLAGFTPEQEQQLAAATYVYVQSERKSGEWGKPAEIWFFTRAGKLYVGTRPDSWRVRRIKAGRVKARIAIGKVDGPAFEATGALSGDAAVQAAMLDAYATKYPAGWKKYEQSFRDGFKTGERVLVEYTPR